jgi:hypothetical protein
MEKATTTKQRKSFKTIIQNKIKRKKAATTIQRAFRKSKSRKSINTLCPACLEEIDSTTTCQRIQCGHIMHQKCLFNLLYDYDNPECLVCDEKIQKNQKCEVSLKRLIQRRITNKIPRKKSSIKKNISFGKAKVRYIEKQNKGYQVFQPNLEGESSLKVETESESESDDEETETDTDDELYSTRK